MTWLAPWLLAPAVAGALAVVALHFFAFQRPPRAVLPTARFVPDRPARAASRARRPSDLVLMAIRALVLLLAGAAFAGPVPTPSRRPVARVLLVDASRAVARPAEAADSARAMYRTGDAVVVFDSSARAMAATTGDAAASLAARADSVGAGAFGPLETRPRGSLSAGLVAAMREAGSLRERADSVELVVISPLVAEEMDEATRPIRALWKGRVRLVPVAAAADTGDGVRRAPVPIAVRGAADDPLRVAASLAPSASPLVRLVRDSLTSRDLGDAAVGGVIVHWPAAGTPEGWAARERVDTVGAVAFDGGVAVAPFERRWRLPEAPADSGPRAEAVIARWPDGEPAAAERVVKSGCVRTVAAGFLDAGDLALRPSVGRLLAALAVPCGGARRLEAAAGAREWLAGTGPLLATASLAGAEGARSPLAPWLLGAAIALALVEMALRARRRAA